MAKAISAKSRVTKYRAKRDFAKTSEPTGKKALPSSSALRFVVQRHDARRLHYDLRLELDGVFKSWAVTRGPSLNPHDGLKRGELKFSLEGERLKGGWVLVRMKNDRSGGKHTNWLLIKHRDDDARDGDGDALLTDPKSIASGRNPV